MGSVRREPYTNRDPFVRTTYRNGIYSGADLSEAEAEASLDFLLEGADEALISAFLVLLRAKVETYEEVACEAWARLGDPKEVICHEVKRVQQDFLVVGSRGLGPFQKCVLYGSKPLKY